jgi:hypothetical protein
MTTYSFEVSVAGPVTDAHIESLFGAGCDDALVSGDERGGRITFDRDADDAVVAVVSAIEQVESCGLRVTGVTEDLVTLDALAERTMRSPAAVGHWVTGARGPGGFPAPRVARDRGSLYSWAEVAAWLVAHRLGDVDHAAAETAQACTLISAALTLRHGLRNLPQRDRPLIAGLVA